MPVIPGCTNLLQDEQELYQILLACQKKSHAQGCSQIVSFSQEIELFDPLLIYQAVAQPHQLNFYWENRRNTEAIAAIGSTKQIKIESTHRFVQSQQFIQNCLSQIIKTGNLNLPGSGPRFFCSFTFFNSPQTNNLPFPPATIFLPRFQITQTKKSCVLVTNIAINYQENLELIIRKIRQQIKKIVSFSEHNFSQKNNRKLNKNKTTTDLTQFKTVVASALKSIEKSQFSKIVLAHTLDVISPVPFQLVESLNNLRQRHPDCYIFSTSNGKGHNFIGASPERLISIQNHQLVTDALAGSAPRGKTASEDARFANLLLGSEKERREHHSVTQFIIQRLSELGLMPQRSPLQLLQLSNIQHLWTPIQAQLPIHIHPLEIVAQLHPTPAVAGVPTPIACQQIRRYETFDRALYAAPIGWVDYQGNGEFIVGIRSALIAGNQARLYAGAGIVAGSDPEKELAEVQLKLQAMLKALV